MCNSLKNSICIVLLFTCFFVSVLGAKANNFSTPEVDRTYSYLFLEAVNQKESGNYSAAYDLLIQAVKYKPTAAPAFYELAQLSYILQDLNAAEEFLVKAVKFDPENYWYSLAAVNAYIQKEDKKDAISLLESMRTQFPGRDDVLFMLIDIYTKEGKYPKVISLLDSLEERFGKNEQLSMEKFRMFLYLEDKERAIEEIEGLIIEYPAELKYRVVLGDLYLQLGMEEQALDCYEMVLSKDPENPIALYSLASYYQKKGEREKQKESLDKLLLNKKTDSQVKLNVMRQLILQNEQEATKDSMKIISLFNEVLAIDEFDDQLPMLYAQYLMSKNMRDEAKPVLEHVLQLDPSNSAVRLMLVGEALSKENPKEVIGLCEPAMITNPDRIEFYFYLVLAYLTEDRFDEAIEVGEKAKKLIDEETPKELSSHIYSMLGDSYYRRGEKELMYEAYDKAIELNSSNWGTLNNYAYYLSVDRKELDKAEEMSYQAIKAEPQNPTFLDTYAWILFQKGEFEQARIYIDEALKHETEPSAAIQEHAGDIYYKLGEVDLALTFWKKASELGDASALLLNKIKQRKYLAK